MERIKIIDGTTWPNPYGEEFGELQWKLRYDQLNISTIDLYNAASVMEAYQDILTHPAFTLDKVRKKVSSIRKLGKEVLDKMMGVKNENKTTRQ